MVDREVSGQMVERLVWVDPETKVAQLAYYVEFQFMNRTLFSRPTFFLDACTKDVITSYDQVRTSVHQWHSKFLLKQYI